jgi:VanZ family protein
MPTTVRESPVTRSSIVVPPLVRGLCLALAAAIVFNLFFLAAKPFAAGLFPAPWDKLAHFAVYGGLTALLWVGAGGRMLFTVIAAVAAIGGLDELHQAGIPGRVSDIGDFAADALAGITVGALMLLYARRKSRTEPVCAE